LAWGVGGMTFIPQNCVIDFTSMEQQSRRDIYAEANFIAPNLNDYNGNVVVDLNPFVLFATQD
jgi:hypothetical protein